MTLYYLQRCSPPVIPILQELYDGDRPPERIVDGYNTWFFEDLDRLQEKWIHFGANTLSVGNLFYGFTKFYAEIFPFDTLVVCIRRSRDLTKMEKKWTGRRIAIEGNYQNKCLSLVTNYNELNFHLHLIFFFVRSILTFSQSRTRHRA